MSINATGFGALVLIFVTGVTMIQNNRNEWWKLFRFWLLVVGLLSAIVLTVHDRWYLDLLVFGILSYIVGTSFKILQTRGYTDVLTGLKSRRYLDFYEVPRGSTVIYIDVDKFKSINDLYGHRAGDCVLIDMARILTESARKTDFVIRMGGDEFVVITMNDKTNGASFVVRLEENMEKYNEEVLIHISMNYGVAVYDGESLSKAIAEADQEMYKRKTKGKEQ